MTELYAGVDAGTECVKVVLLDGAQEMRGQAVVSRRGYFQDRIVDAWRAALDDAQALEGDVRRSCATGFGARCMADASMRIGDAASHARGAFAHHRGRMTVLDIGGTEPTMIKVHDDGHFYERRTVRKCAVGTGTFLAETARYLDVHPTRLMALAARSERPAAIGSYCSVFAASDTLERLRDGATRPEVALGAMHSVAERILEIGGMEPPLFVAGGVVEYYPAVLVALYQKSGCELRAVPSPIFNGALGAALLALESA